MQGKLIVIEGTDGSGKKTQTNILLEKLKQENYQYETMEFPRHEQPFFGIMVDRYLNGEFGSASEVNPYFASILYALDRWEVKDKLQNWLNQGKIVVLDRYVPSNKGHQAGKIKDKEELDKFLKWLDEMEYETLKIPKPDLVIILYVPYELTIKLMRESHDKKGYSKDNKPDIHERDKQHMIDTQKSYLEMVEKYPNWIKIDCTEDGNLLSKEEISKKVWETVKERLNK